MNKRIDTDHELLKKCVSGDTNAWDKLSSKYSGLMLLAIKKRLAKSGAGYLEHCADDILQDALTRVWQDNKLSSIRQPGCLPYWLCMVAQNSAVQHIRGDLRRPDREPLSNYEDEDTGELIIKNGPGRKNYQSESIPEELSAKAREAVESLPHNEKLVIKLHIYHGKKYSEIASMLSVPLGTVSCNINRAKSKIKDALERFFIFFAIISSLLASYIVRGYYG